MISDTLAIVIAFLVCIILAVRPQVLGLGILLRYFPIERIRILAFCLFLLCASLILNTGNTIALH